MTDVVIVDAVRTPMGRSKAGVFRNVRAEALSAELIKALMRRNPAVNPKEIEDVIWGCVQQTKEQGFNIARQASLLAGLPIEVSGQTVNRLCGSSMTAIHAAVGSIQAGAGDIFICGGVEHMGHVPMDYNFDGNPELSVTTAKAAAMMGLTAEMLATAFQLPRARQDEFALASHQKAAAALKNGGFKNEMIPIAGHDADGLPILVDFDEVVRGNANLEDLGKLKPAFNPKGSVTAGNSSAISDGASAVLICSEQALKDHGLTPRARTKLLVQALDEGDDRASIFASLAKAKGGEVAKLATNEGVQLHGGIGMTDEYDIGLYMKRDRALAEFMGDAYYHAERVARLSGY